MKKAINAWTIPNHVSFADMFAAIADAGYQGIELNIDRADASAHSLTMDSSAAQYDQINALSARYSLPVCSISTSLYGGALGSPDEPARAFAQSLLRKQLECADALGANGILAVPGGISEEVSIRQAYENSAHALQQLLPDIQKARIQVGLENVWNGFFESPMDMARFIDELACPYVGAYFDVGNVAVHAQPEYWIDILGERIRLVHVKDFLTGGRYEGKFVNLLQGSIRWEKVMAALRSVGYEGYITAELGQMPPYSHYLYTMTAQALDILLQL